MMRICPREVGRRLHTLAVKAGKRCSGSPNLSSVSGCTWYSMFGVACSGEERVKPPSCDGAIVSGPVRNSAYSSAIFALPIQLLASLFSVSTFCTLNPMRSCRWSCRFSPTPGSSCATGMPCRCSSGAGPMPESCRICVLPIEPAASTVSIRASAN